MLKVRVFQNHTNRWYKLFLHLVQTVFQAETMCTKCGNKAETNCFT